MGKQELIKKWKGNRRYTLKFLDVVAEEQFTFKPIEGMKSYQSQLSHITTWLRTHSRFVSGVDMEKLPTKNKEEIRIALEDFFDSIIAFLENTTSEILDEKTKVWYGNVSKEAILLTMDNHLSHHRGQMVVYLRLLDIKAPSYIGW
ncbi:MAG: DinB family protein [Bacteroidia bacterium]|nr:DinB family protein [Bacteroidia bacterium]